VNLFLPDDSITGIADPDKHTLASAAQIPEQQPIRIAQRRRKQAIGASGARALALTAQASQEDYSRGYAAAIAAVAVALGIAPADVADWTRDSTGVRW